MNEALAVEVRHRTAQLIAVQHQLHVAKTTMITMKKLAQLVHTITTRSSPPKFVGSRSLYVIVRPSVVCRLSVVCNVRAPYSDD